MGWSLGYDTRWNRDIGYGVPAQCDHPECTTEIDRGLSYVCCCQDPYGGDGCGLYFCGEHADVHGKCERCQRSEPPFAPKPDIAEWIEHKLTDASWSHWRDDHPSEVLAMNHILAESRRPSSVTIDHSGRHVPAEEENRTI